MARSLFARFPFLSSPLLRHPQSRGGESPEPWPAELAWSVALCVAGVVSTGTGWWLCYQSIFELGGSGVAWPCAAGHILPPPPRPNPTAPDGRETRGQRFCPAGCWRTDCFLIQPNNQEMLIAR